MVGIVRTGDNVRRLTIKRDLLEKIAELLEIPAAELAQGISVYISTSSPPPPPPPPGGRARRAAPSRGARPPATSRPRPRRK